MLKVAICDDILEITAQLEIMLIELGKKYLIEVDIGVFFSGEDLLKYMDDGNSLDLIFLDIEMKEVNGIQVGLKIREGMKDDNTQIAYISGKSNYAMELFQVRPINFLVKPLYLDSVESVFLTALRLIRVKNSYFKYKKGHSYNKIELKDIIYFESENRKVNIITKYGIDTFYSLMDKVYNDIRDKGFLYIHKSYIINTLYINSFMYDKVIMSNDIVLPISQSRRSIIRDQLLNFNTKGE